MTNNMSHENLGHHFMSGRYNMCIKVLEKLQITLFKPSSIGANNNMTVCTLLKDLTVISRDWEDTLVSSLKDLRHCLKQMQSFPPSISNMKIELTILYNWLYIKLILSMKSTKQELQASLYECGSNYMKALVRVLSCVKHKVADDAFDEEAIVQHLRELCKYSELLKVYRVISPLCFTGCAWSTLLLYKGKHKQSLTCLDTVLLFCDNSSENKQEAWMSMSPTGFLLSLPDSEELHGSDPGLSAPDLVRTLTGLCHYCLSNWSHSRDSLSIVGTSYLQPHLSYITGLCHLNEHDPKQCLSCLEKMTGSDVSPRMKARILHLNAQCYEQMGLHQCAVQMSREALQTDFSYVLPLLHISQLYRTLGQEEAELEALNLLVTIVEDSSDDHGDKEGVTSIWTGVIFQQVCPELTVSLPQTLYTLAHRCLQLHRYSDGAPRYLDLLSVLCDSDHLPPKTDITSAIKIPDIRVIYTETAECLLLACQHEDCITVCEKALEAVCLNLDTSASSSAADDMSLLLDPEDIEDLSQTLNASNRKRQRVHSSDLDLDDGADNWQELEHYMTLTMYKADAHICLDDKETAVILLHRAVEVLQECIGRWSPVPRVNATQSSQPAPKRRKMGEEEALISTDSQETDQSESWKVLLVKACRTLATLLSDQAKYPDALHFSRLALQIQPDNTELWLTCCKVLEGQGRGEEAATTWLQRRGLATLSDRHLLARELAQRQTQLRNLSSSSANEESFSRQESQMDIRSLHCLLKNRKTSIF